mmetsp:Transcript_6812/g.23760  ORF Transcript_6812/g.23760 Transcript_6812/m.23760 type:complete len:262 (-) Transcript_6812:11229-12014(-)
MRVVVAAGEVRLFRGAKSHEHRDFPLGVLTLENIARAVPDLGGLAPILRRQVSSEPAVGLLDRDIGGHREGGRLAVAAVAVVVVVARNVEARKLRASLVEPRAVLDLVGTLLDVARDVLVRAHPCHEIVGVERQGVDGADHLLALESKVALLRRVPLGEKLLHSGHDLDSLRVELASRREDELVAVVFHVHAVAHPAPGVVPRVAREHGGVAALRRDCVDDDGVLGLHVDELSIVSEDILEVAELDVKIALRGWASRLKRS